MPEPPHQYDVWVLLVFEIIFISPGSIQFVSFAEQYFVPAGQESFQPTQDPPPVELVHFCAFVHQNEEFDSVQLSPFWRQLGLSGRQAL